MATTLDGATQDDRRSHEPRASEWGGTVTERQVGMWSARVLFGIGVAYVVVMVAGFSWMASFSKPLQDPYLAVAEVLILIMAPVMVMLMTVVHMCGPQRTRIWSLTALGWMLLAAGFTMTVHLVELTVVRRITPGAVQGYQYLFSFRWPSVLYGIDIVAWDIFFAFAILSVVPVFRALGHRTLSNWLLAAGALSLLGIIGPAINHIGVREIGIFGYAVVFPITCLGISKAFHSTLGRHAGRGPVPASTNRRPFSDAAWLRLDPGMACEVSAPAPPASSMTVTAGQPAGVEHARQTYTPVMLDPGDLCEHSGQRPRAMRQPARTGRRPSPAPCRLTCPLEANG